MASDRAKTALPGRRKSTSYIVRARSAVGLGAVKEKKARPKTASTALRQAQLEEMFIKGWPQDEDEEVMDDGEEGEEVS